MASTRQPQIGSIILAGAHPWGDSPLEWIGPRPLLPVAGRPLVWYGLDWLRRGGVAHVTICANSDTSAVRACMEDGSGMGLAIDYYEDMMPRGPAGCIRDAAMGRMDDVFVVVEGALLPRADLQQILKAHAETRSVLTIVAIEEEPVPGGGAPLKPAGIYVLSRQALALVPERGYQDIKEMWIPRLHQHGCRVVPYVISADAVIGVTGLGSYLRAAVCTLENVAVHGGWRGDYHRVGGAWVHRSARVSTSARLSELVLIGPRAWIEPKAVILGRTIVGPDSRIGASAILSDFVSWPGCEVGHGAILNRCILLAGSSIEPGLVVRDTVYCRSTAGRGELLGGTAGDYWAMEPLHGPAVPSTHLIAAAKPRRTTPAYRPPGASPARPAPAPGATLSPSPM